ncbi:MAG: hypothetical protein AAGF12_27075 [Myxococcota bacterium]
MRGYAFVLALLGLLACSDDSGEPAEPVAPSPPEKAPPVEVSDDDLAALEAPPSPEEFAGVAETELPSVATLDLATPDRGCITVTDAPVRIWPSAGPTTVLGVGDRFIVAGHASRPEGGEHLFVLSVAPERPPRPLRTVSLDAPLSATDRKAPPALIQRGPSRLYVAAVDARGRVVAGDIHTGSATARLPLTAVGEGADTRFAPALGQTGDHTIVAWTARGTPMRVQTNVINAEGTSLSRQNVTPPTMGGAAPAFIDGAEPPRLVFMDPRAGLSPIVWLRFPEGQPEEATVARPVGTATEPPRVVGAMVGERPFAAYTAVGDLATTAVGLVPLGDGGSGAPTPLVPGTGYGVLQVDAVSTGGSAVFAASVPTDTPPTAPRTIHVRRVDSEGPGEPLTIAGPNEHGERPAIGRRSDGTLAVTFVSEDAIYAAWVRCAS